MSLQSNVIVNASGGPLQLQTLLAVSAPCYVYVCGGQLSTIFWSSLLRSVIKKNKTVYKIQVHAVCSVLLNLSANAQQLLNTS